MVHFGRDDRGQVGKAIMGVVGSWTLAVLHDLWDELAHLSRARAILRTPPTPAHHAIPLSYPLSAVRSCSMPNVTSKLARVRARIAGL